MTRPAGRALADTAGRARATDGATAPPSRYPPTRSEPRFRFPSLHPLHDEGDHLLLALHREQLVAGGPAPCRDVSHDPRIGGGRLDDAGERHSLDRLRHLHGRDGAQQALQVECEICPDGFHGSPPRLTTWSSTA